MTDRSKIHTSFCKQIEAGPERIASSAIWFKDGITHEYQPDGITDGFVVMGYRHHVIFHTMWILIDEQRFNKYETLEFGFVTNRYRFLNREDAYIFAKTYLDYLPDDRDALYSEDLW